MGTDEFIIDQTDTRQRLVNAAVEVFLEKGYGGTRVADIAKRAGFTPGALYVHFPSRTALLGEAIVAEGERILSDLLESFRDLRPGDGMISRVMADQTTAPSERVDQLLLDALALAARDIDAREMLASTFARLDATLLHQINRAKDVGAIDASIDADALRTFFTGWIFGLVVLRAVNLPRSGPEEMFAVTLRMMSGLAPPDSPSSDDR